jgi:hypothetical protein
MVAIICNVEPMVLKHGGNICTVPLKPLRCLVGNIINMTSGTLVQGCWILALPLRLYNVAFIITKHPCNFLE